MWQNCTNRESNPGQMLGRHLCYHYTIGAVHLFDKLMPHTNTTTYMYPVIYHTNTITQLTTLHLSLNPSCMSLVSYPTLHYSYFHQCTTMYHQGNHPLPDKHSSAMPLSLCSFFFPYSQLKIIPHVVGINSNLTNSCTNIRIWVLNIVS